MWCPPFHIQCSRSLTWLTWHVFSSIIYIIKDVGLTVRVARSVRPYRVTSIWYSEIDRSACMDMRGRKLLANNLDMLWIQINTKTNIRWTILNYIENSKILVWSIPLSLHKSIRKPSMKSYTQWNAILCTESTLNVSDAHIQLEFIDTQSDNACTKQFMKHEHEKCTEQINTHVV